MESITAIGLAICACNSRGPEALNNSWKRNVLLGKTVTFRALTIPGMLASPGRGKHRSACP